MRSCSEIRNASDSNGNGRALKQVLLCSIYGAQASTRQARGKPETWICQHQPLPMGVPEGWAGCSRGGTNPWYPGQALRVPLWWLSIAPGRFLRVSGQSLHLPSTNWGLQTVSSTDNTKGTNSWITNALFFWLHLETSSQKRKKWARILFLLPHLQTAMLVLCGVQEQEDKLAAPCPGWHPKSD